MRLEVHDCVENEVTGHKPPHDVRRVLLTHDENEAVLVIEGDIPPPTNVRMTVAGVFLISPYGCFRPFRVEIAPSSTWSRSAIWRSEKTLLERGTERVVIRFVRTERDSPHSEMMGGCVLG